MRTPETTKELADLMSAFLNSYIPEYDQFIELMNREHRTLQQSFTRLCLKWLENCASKDYGFDLRNEDSHTISKTIIDSFIKAMKAEEFGDNAVPSNWLAHV